ncbi:citrate synthase, partial [Trypanosoma conorhini]
MPLHHLPSASCCRRPVVPSPLRPLRFSLHLPVSASLPFSLVLPLAPAHIPPPLPPSGRIRLQALNKSKENYPTTTTATEKMLRFCTRAGAVLNVYSAARQQSSIVDELKGTILARHKLDAPRIKALKEKCGGEKLSDATVGAAYGGMRGITGLVYEPCCSTGCTAF